MRTFIFFICTCFISTGIYFASLNSRHPEYGITIAIAMWAWFLWGYNCRASRKAQQRAMYRRF